MNYNNTTMKDSQALVKPVLLAVVCLCFLLMHTCHENKQAATEIVQETAHFAISPGY